MEALREKIGFSTWSFTEEEFQGHRFLALRKVTYPMQGQSGGIKNQIITISPKNLDAFKDLLKEIIRVCPKQAEGNYEN